MIWLAWFSSRQYSVISRIREEYAFKYATALAYEGYKEASSNVDERLEFKLLKLAIANMGDNPTKVYNYKNASSPFDSIIEAISSISFKGKNDQVEVEGSLNKSNSD